MKRLLKYLIPIAAVAAVIYWQLGGEEDPTNNLLQIIEDSRQVTFDSEYEGCLECHDNFDRGLQEGSLLVSSFNHAFHREASGNVGCANCHVLNPHDEEATIRPTMDDCFECHGAAAEAPLPCLVCHTSLLISPPPSHFASDWGAVHGVSAAASDSICVTCHSQEQFCISCHGVRLPHEEDWIPGEHARTALEIGVASCDRCHERGPHLTERDLCDTCHHPQLPEIGRWLDAHFEIVKAEGAGTCFECHDANTCSTCHSTGTTDFRSDLNKLDLPEVEEAADE
jgi:hypothetical protein